MIAKSEILPDWNSAVNVAINGNINFTVSPCWVGYGLINCFENDLIYLKGSIPGSKNSKVILRGSVKNISRKTIKEKYDAKIKAMAAKKGKK